MDQALLIAGLAFGLAMDAFAVAIAAGCTLPSLTGRRVFRLAWHFGLFQFMMPLLGWSLAGGVSKLFQQLDHWIAFGLLALVGGKMILEAIRGEEKRLDHDPTRGWSLITLSVATSIDALAVGLTLRLMDIGVWTPCIIIGVVACIMTILGMAIGRYVGSKTGRWAEIVGGSVLLFIGLRILISSLVEAT